MNANTPGGVRIAPHKQLAALSPAIIAPVPERLIISLQQASGSESIPAVSAGDQVLTGQIIATPAEDDYGSYIHASSSGTVVAIEESTADETAGCIHIQTDGSDTLHPDCRPVVNIQNLAGNKLTRIIAEAGIVGLGGALFPTAEKLRSKQDIHTLIINGAECEPYINCDNQVLQQYPERVIQGAEIMARAVDAPNIIIACKSEMIDARRALNDALQNRPEHSDTTKDIRIVAVADHYPIGGEKQLISFITGKEVPAEGLPVELGIICQNAGTAKAVHDRFLLGKPLISRLVTLTGDSLTQSINAEVRIGTGIRDLINGTVGLLNSPDKIIMGGPMMGVPLNADTQPVTKACNCIIVTRELQASTPELPCIRCGDCLPVCPAGLSPLLLLEQSKRGDENGLETSGVLECIECGCCDYVCPSAIPLTTTFRTAKSHVKEQRLLHSRAERSQDRFKAHASRVEERQKQEQQQLDAQTGEFDAKDGKKALDDLMKRLGNKGGE